MGWTGFPEEVHLEPKDQNEETARGTGPTFLVTETAWAKALRLEGARHLGKTMVIGAQKAEDDRRYGSQTGGEGRECLKAMLRLSWSHVWSCF